MRGIGGERRVQIERERERERERGNERILSRLCAVSAQPSVGLDLMNCEIVT